MLKFLNSFFMLCLYFIIMVPLGLLLKLSNRDPLKLKFDEKAREQDPERDRAGANDKRLVLRRKQHDDDAESRTRNHGADAGCVDVAAETSVHACDVVHGQQKAQAGAEVDHRLDDGRR